MHNERDDPWCRYPGIYASMPARSFRRAWQVAGSYRRFNDPAHLVEPSRVRSDPDLLYSFVGSPTHACRKALLDLTGPRSHVEVVEGFLFWDPSSRDFELRRRRFAEILLRSTFVLCPRGNGTASIRLFETLAAGRVPVILADSWVPPAAPTGRASRCAGPRTTPPGCRARSRRSRHRPGRWGCVPVPPTSPSSPPTSCSPAS